MMRCVLAAIAPTDTYTKNFSIIIFGRKCSSNASTTLEAATLAQTRKNLRRTPYPALRAFPSVPTPGTHWVFDFVGKFPTDYLTGANYILSFVCESSRWMESFPTKGQTSQEVADLFVREICCRFGPSQLIRSDNARSFNNDLMAQVCRMMNTKQVFSAPRSPQSQGIVERWNSTLYKVISMYINNKHNDWSSILSFVLLNARMCFNASTQETPAYLMFGRDFQLPVSNAIENRPREQYYELEEYQVHLQLKLNTAWQLASQNIEQAHEIQKRHFDKRRLCAPYKYYIGSKVLVRDYKNCPPGRSKKFYPKYFGVWRVISQSNQNNYLVQLLSNHKKQLWVPYFRLRPCYEPYIPKLRVLNSDSEEESSETQEMSDEDEEKMTSEKENPSLGKSESKTLKETPELGKISGTKAAPPKSATVKERKSSGKKSIRKKNKQETNEDSDKENRPPTPPKHRYNLRPRKF